MNEPQLSPRGLFIPLELFDDDRISHSDRFLVVLIDMLDNDERHCYATNAYLAKRLRVAPQQVANALVKLRGAGWVRDIPCEEERRLTTPLRDARKRYEQLRASAVTDFGIDPYQNDEAPVTNFGTALIQGRDLVSDVSNEESALSIFKTLFPDVTPNLFQQDQLATYVTDLSKWRTTVIFWKTNGYQGRHIGRLIDCYTNGNAFPKENGNGYKQQVMGMAVQDDLAQYPNRCPICGNLGAANCSVHKNAQ